ncbi:hypothetical protein Phum_PHUM344100 [Pediculus humanus corporis]|uniref:Uncharacterized protein n=1 Tax=Pediculus humanus subsp. corporis TaxID=121224 RepID=E0VNT0_PEDHC|nr:uncharacterized protein Phum_PHUM344100 [Pediculus humanus corporis]EEB15036.1 hypothetical protein Phum_PHUM344100 [Pediculus humanus corporis]
MEKPVRYTTSQTAKIDIKENLGFNQKDEKELWYKKYVIAISLSAFMIYFFIIRDENDIDDFITNKDNCNKYTTLLQLTMKLEAVKIVEDAIRFADQIFEVNTENVEPLVTVLEDECLHVREDIEKNEITRAELLSHCEQTVENYYVAENENIKSNFSENYNNNINTDSSVSYPRKKKLSENN